MKILLYSHFFYPEVGAASIRAQYFAKVLKKNGHNVRIISPLPNYPRGKVFEGYKAFQTDEERGVTYLPIYISKGHSLLGRMMSYFSFVVSSVLYSVFNHYQPDVIISSSPPIFTPMAAALVAKIKRSKFILDLRDLWPDIGIELGILKGKTQIKVLRIIEKFILSSADFITVTAGSEKKYLINKGINPDIIEVIYNGADTSIFHPVSKEEKKSIRTRHNLPLDKKLLIYFGSFNDGMNDIDTLGDLLKDMENFNEYGHFVAIGDGSNRDDFLKKIEEKIDYTYFNTLKNVEVAEILSAADLSIIPRKFIKRDTGGNVPVKCFESWGSEIPVLLATIEKSEIAEIFSECNGGRIVAPNDISQLKIAVKDLLTNNNLEELGKRGRELVVSKYDRNNQANKLNNLISRMF